MLPKMMGWSKRGPLITMRHTRACGERPRLRRAAAAVPRERLPRPLRELPDVLVASSSEDSGSSSSSSSSASPAAGVGDRRRQGRLLRPLSSSLSPAPVDLRPRAAVLPRPRPRPHVTTQPRPAGGAVAGCCNLQHEPPRVEMVTPAPRLKETVYLSWNFAGTCQLFVSSN